MSNEITINGSVQYEDDDNSSAILQVIDAVFSSASRRPTRLKQNVGITEEAINLGDITTPGYAIFVNRDPDNTIDLRVSSGGAKFARLDPDADENGKGGFAILKLGSGAQTPYAIANTEACEMDILICST